MIKCCILNYLIILCKDDYFLNSIHIISISLCTIVFFVKKHMPFYCFNKWGELHIL